MNQKIYKAYHKTPSPFCYEYILLPYGQSYRKTANLLKAKKGDTLRFLDGPDCKIMAVLKINQDAVCDALCRMRYGYSWEVVFTKWQRYAVLEGNDKCVLSKRECLIVFYDVPDKL